MRTDKDLLILLIKHATEELTKTFPIPGLCKLIRIMRSHKWDNILSYKESARLEDLIKHYIKEPPLKNILLKRSVCTKGKRDSIHIDYYWTPFEWGPRIKYLKYIKKEIG